LSVHAPLAGRIQVLHTERGGIVGKIAISNLDDTESTRAIDNMDEERRTRFSQGELECERRRLFPVGDESLELFEIKFAPNSEAQAHGHSTAEIIYVTQGELRLGAHIAGPGTAIYIDANTLYGFKVGPEGATFLNFRAEPRPAYLFKEDLAAIRAEGRA
jgi:quercetin dioxygenase-like cupin family protein